MDRVRAFQFVRALDPDGSLFITETGDAVYTPGVSLDAATAQKILDRLSDSGSFDTQIKSRSEILVELGKLKPAERDALLIALVADKLQTDPEFLDKAGIVASVKKPKEA